MVHSILCNRLYIGWFEWNGKLYEGKHEPLVSVELWERVQGVMDGRNASKHRRMTHDFASSGNTVAAQRNVSGYRLGPFSVIYSSVSKQYVAGIVHLLAPQ